ncbi:MAG: hypothetical protein ACQEXQ_23180 [Bacillota bacterium]
MLNKIDFKALAVGVLIFLFSIFAFGFLLVAVLAEISIQAGFEMLSHTNELVFEFLLAWFSIFWAGYYTYKMSRKSKLYHSLLLGFFIFAYQFIGTLLSLFDPQNDPFIINILYDGSIIFFSYLGGKLAKRNRLKQSSALDIEG